jgi:hypothetical protein
MNYQKKNSIISWLIFAISLVVYMMTVSPTVSYWDCGEFIAASYKLAVPHPPGAPFYLLLGRIFSMLPIPFISDIGYKVNLISVLSSAFSVMLLYLSIVHLVREWKGSLKTDEEWQTAIYAGIIGALSFAFTHSFWFNSVEAEVYAPSMLFTALLVWLILVWAEKSDKPGNERYILMIAYLVGLAMGVHLLNVLAIPFVTLIIFYKRFPFTWKNFFINAAVTGAIMLIIYPGIVKYLPLIALHWGVFILVLLLAGIVWLAFWSVNNKKDILSLISLSTLLIIIGYSTYIMIYVRSNLNPMIDENNPETVENFVKYLNREQYGDHSITDRTQVWHQSENANLYSSSWDFFWNYQINKMYIRYFAWQFIGMDENEHDASANQLFALPFLLGIAGLWWQFKNDQKHGLAVLALFFMTGVAIILYLNQPDPQPRERDYSYVGSFFAFSIWIGLGYAGVMELIKGNKKELAKGKLWRMAVFILLLLAVPVHMFAKNFHTHNRSGRYIAWDYSYNMLQSCEPDAILFTNGDNDTFPLWYLQEVEGIRTDIRIVNLSLLNTDWYINQLRDLEPKVPMRMNDMQIANVGLMPWNTKNNRVTLKVPQEKSRDFAESFRNFRDTTIEPPRSISFSVQPTINLGNRGSYLRTQDWMILNLLSANQWEHPVYFAVTVARSNMLSELYDYMRMDGLVFKVVPFKNWRIEPELLEQKLTEVYQYRGLDNPKVYFDNNIIGLLQNYRSAFFQLITYYLGEDNQEKAQELVKIMEEKTPASIIPFTNRRYELIKESLLMLDDSVSLDSIDLSKYSDTDLFELGRNLFSYDRLNKAQILLENAFELNPENAGALSYLINIYERSGQNEKLTHVLEEWLIRRPNDTGAKTKLAEIKQKLMN